MPNQYFFTVDRVITLFRDKGKTITEFATSLNKTQGNISARIHSGKYKVEFLYQICDFLDIQLTELLVNKKSGKTVKSIISEWQDSSGSMSLLFIEALRGQHTKLNQEIEENPDAVNQIQRLLQELSSKKDSSDQ